MFFPESPQLLNLIVSDHFTIKLKQSKLSRELTSTNSALSLADKNTHLTCLSDPWRSAPWCQWWSRWPRGSGSWRPFQYPDPRTQSGDGGCWNPRPWKLEPRKFNTDETDPSVAGATIHLNQLLLFLSAAAAAAAMRAAGGVYKNLRQDELAT